MLRSLPPDEPYHGYNLADYYQGNFTIIQHFREKQSPRRGSCGRRWADDALANIDRTRVIVSVMSNKQCSGVENTVWVHNRTRHGLAVDHDKVLERQASH